MSAHIKPLNSFSQRAFSLVELLVVITLILVLTSTAIISYQNFRSDGILRSAGDQVRVLMIEARQRAIVENTPTSFTIDLDNRSMWVDILPTPTSQGRPKVITPEFFHPDVILEELRVGSETFTAGTHQVRFSANGTNQFATLVLRRADGDINNDRSFLTVQIFPQSAEARIWENARR